MRELLQIINAQETQDGDGVKIYRLAGRRLHQALNPFLMIDEINSDDASEYIGGFPEHPHRGFETITYMKAGLMRHRDHMGNEGVISAGDVQWMTAGEGVLHSEMPEQVEGLLHGFQLWLNLPAAEKMQPATYRELSSSLIAEKTLPKGGLIRAIAGKVLVDDVSLQGDLRDKSTEPILLDVELQPNESVELDFNNENSALIYVYRGSTELLTARQLGLYSTGNKLKVKASSSGSGFLVLSGRHIHEPIAQYGPFVMNARSELEQAISDFQNPHYLKQLNLIRGG